MIVVMLRWKPFLFSRESTDLTGVEYVAIGSLLLVVNINRIKLTACRRVVLVTRNNVGNAVGFKMAVWTFVSSALGVYFECILSLFYVISRVACRNSMPPYRFATEST